MAAIEPAPPAAVTTDLNGHTGDFADRSIGGARQPGSGEPVAVGKRAARLLDRLVPRRVEVERNEEPLPQRVASGTPVTRSAIRPR